MKRGKKFWQSPPERLTKKELRERIIIRAKKVLRECNECIIIGEWLAANRVDIVPPIDVEDFRVARDSAIKTLKEFGEIV